MDKLTQLVKKQILTYPSLYTTRWSALQGIYLSTNFIWDANGCLHEAYSNNRSGDKMNYSDLERRLRTAAEENLKIVNKTDYGYEYSMQHLRDCNLEIRQRQFIEQNIDDIACCKHDHSNDNPLSIINGVSEYSVLFNTPSNAEPVFLEGADEVITTALQKLYFLAERKIDDGARAKLIILREKLWPGREAAMIETVTSIVRELKYESP